MANELFVGPGGFATITAAIAEAGQFDTIRVAPGTYNETVIIDKTIQLLGAQAGIDARTRSGPESIITGDDGSALVQLVADNAVFDGFTVQGNALSAGIFAPANFSGYWIFNNIVRDNVFGLYFNASGATYSQVRNNLFSRNIRPGSASGNGIYTDAGLSNAVVDSNLFTGHNIASILLEGTTGPISNVVISHNQIINDRAVGLIETTNIKIVANTISGSRSSGVFLGGGTDLTEIEGNQILNSMTVGIRVVTDAVPNANIRAKNNAIAGNVEAGLRIHPGGYAVTPRRLDATNNWWGSPTGPSGNGPGTGDAVIDPEGVAEIVPFLTFNPLGAPSCEQKLAACEGSLAGVQAELNASRIALSAAQAQLSAILNQTAESQARLRTVRGDVQKNLKKSEEEAAEAIDYLRDKKYDRAKHEMDDTKKYIRRAADAVRGLR